MKKLLLLGCLLQVSATNAFAQDATADNCIIKDSIAEDILEEAKIRALKIEILALNAIYRTIHLGSEGAFYSKGFNEIAKDLEELTGWKIISKALGKAAKNVSGTSEKGFSSVYDMNFTGFDVAEAVASDMTEVEMKVASMEAVKAAIRSNSNFKTIAKATLDASWKVMEKWEEEVKYTIRSQVTHEYLKNDVDFAGVLYLLKAPFLDARFETMDAQIRDYYRNHVLDIENRMSSLGLIP